MGRVYVHKSVVTIGDTDLMQGMYFINYLKLEAVTRELWMMDCVPGYLEDLANGLVLLTRETTCRFLKGFRLNDTINVQLQFTNITRSSFELRFQHVIEGSRALHAEGFQTVVCADRDNKVTKIPENWKAAILEYFCCEQGKGMRRLAGA